MTQNSANLLLELQKILFERVKNIPYIRDGNIKIYSKVPEDALFPFIKIGNFAVQSSNTFAYKQEKIDFSVDVMDKNDTVKPLLEIVSSLQESLPAKTITSQNGVTTLGPFYLGVDLQEDVVKMRYLARLSFSVVIR